MRRVLFLLLMLPTLAVAAPKKVTFEEGSVIDDAKVHAQEDLEIIELKERFLVRIEQSVQDSAFGSRRR
jgi:hypothetical protein